MFLTTAKSEQDFVKYLYNWFSTNYRPLPWKGERDPYLIWLSEIILQQTRVEQGLPYFEKFKAAYPIVTDLANAPEDEVMKMWEGLGYYSRARNLHAAAKYVAFELDGKFPKTLEGIRSLKGVGPYTAAAIASFAFGLPHAVVDGNVYRVLSRYFGIDTPIDSTEGKTMFAKLGQTLLESAVSDSDLTATPGSFNQAMMDFGATHCKPKLPKCEICLMQSACAAFQKNEVGKLPVKAKKMKRRERFFNYFIFQSAGKIFIKKRTEKDIWQNLYDFPIIESEGLVEGLDAFQKNEKWEAWLAGQKIKNNKISAPLKQELTHQRIIARFWEIEIEGEFFPEKNWIEVEREKLRAYAFPKVIGRYFQEKFLPLNLF